jgi:nicotinamide-nucleotide amidase
MLAEIISIGDEITSGQLLDTNSQWLSRRLEEFGVRTLFHTTVGDELEPCVAVLRQAIDRADLIVVTGGLGPTADDLTRQALAEATGRQLYLDADALEYIRAMFARRKRPMPQQNETQAMFPAGSRVVRNPNGTAPGIDLEVVRAGRGSCRAICLPGVPSEMIEMWRDSVSATIAAFVGGDRRVICHRRIHCFGAGESHIESMLPDLIRRGRQPTVGITANNATISLRIAAEGATEQECLAAMEPTVATIRQCLGSLIFGEEDDQLQDVVARRLREQGKTLATAECATSGLLAEWLSGVQCAADAYRGGFVLPERRSRAADSPLCNDKASSFDAVQSAEEMAADCRTRFGADCGLAVGAMVPSTAGEADSDQSNTTPDVVIVLASSDNAVKKIIPCGIHPAILRIYIAKHALNFLREKLA